MGDGVAAYWDWRAQGKCASLSPQQSDKLFFPDAGRSINEAKRFCLGCPVAIQCLEWALEQECGGIWAGTSGEERKGILDFRKQLNGVIVPKKVVERKNIVFS